MFHNINIYMQVLDLLNILFQWSIMQFLWFVELYLFYMFNNIPKDLFKKKIIFIFR